MPGSSDDEEDFAFYGTPLDPIEEDAVPSKRPTPIEEQVVRDKQGKRRFHGAFTGGFSAGYCNSVGSQEGWTPSTFKSSRSGKASAQVQKPEDFMDEEDKSEFGFAPQVLRATADYKRSSTLKRPLMHLPSGPIPGQPVLRDILQPAKETVGVRLLVSMGWRPGQGVGPRLNRVQKMKQKKEIDAASKRVYGCAALPESHSTHKEDGSGDSSNDSQDEDNASRLFAPNDYNAFLVKPKDDFFGMGYKGLDKKPVLSAHVELFQPSFLGMEEKKKKVAIWGQAFGVGALEEDDDDIYAKDDMSQYDFALETSASIAQRQKEEHQAECRSILPKADAQGILEGFVPGRKRSAHEKKLFKPPSLPPDFKAQHIIAKVVDVTVSEQINQESENARKSGLLRHELKPNTRASMLDEPLPVPPLFYPDQASTTVEVSKPNADELLCKGTFRPFASQPEKQVRYEKFLDFSRRGQKDFLSSIQPASMTDWDKEHERSEFEQAARLYKPLSGVMSDRFVSASQNDDSLNPLVPVEKMKHGSAEMQNAAKMKMFGKLTRVTTNWQPSALLCKRFNVPPPSGVPDAPKTSRKKSRFSVFDCLDSLVGDSAKSFDEQLEETVHSQPPTSSCETPTVVKSEGKPSTTDKVSGITSTLARLLADDTGKEQLEPEEKPDLFKAIFLSSDEDSDSEEESVRESQESTNLRNERQNTLRNMSPPRGIFANLDLDSLNASRVSQDEKGSEDSEVVNPDDGKQASPEGSKTLAEDLMYGPRLPSSGSNNIPPATKSYSSTSVDKNQGGVWVERAIGKDHLERSQSAKKPSFDSSSDESVDSENKPSKSSLSLEKSKKDKHKKHSKHKKEKKHKKHKSKSKHHKRKKD